MENKKLQSLSYKPLFIVFVILSLSCPRAIAQETEDEREFDYYEESDKGPDQWGEIRPEWRMCGKGTMQSPIDMLNERVEVVSYFRELKRKYKPSNATIVNRGHDVMLKWEGGAGYIEINETQYELKQCHWHSPSEHTINGRRFDLEVHLVHESQSNRSAVIGILYEFGRPDSFLSEVSEHLEAIAEDGEEKRVVGMVDPNHIRVGSLKYYRYIGSLTVPPCTENVVWTIVSKARTVSREQVNLLRDAVHDDYEVNARPVQPLNNREVKFYQPQLKFM
ncbi:alpha carbonic anhydrase 7-like [Diospyros lotus]|uniref:alpha carbonic anhydrase 7-like n=1 Tax=Diospyros lotus TaxID=55363 RepID=UPI0022542D8C|nr:alpha carbonic anhydrase 7-like [Diospyros lotus]